MRVPRVCAALVALAASACGQDVERPAPAPAASATQEATTTAAVPAVRTPPTFVQAPAVPRPPLLLRAGGIETSAGLWSACWSSGNTNTCADGRPPENPPDMGSPSDIEVAFDTPGWRFSATAVPTGQACGGRAQTMDLPATGPTTHRLSPIGRAGDYTITLNGRSTEAATNRGDVGTSFRWRTSTDGPTQPPSATMSLMATSEGIKVPLGAEFSARALGVSTNAGTVEASAVVTTSTGASLAVNFEPTSQECVPDGSLSLRSSNDDGKAIAGLGPAPYRYAVTLTLNGAVYRGTGTWPQDEIHECSPCTRLRWDPPLPAL